MAETRKVLGQADLAATTETALYTVGTGKSAVCYVVVCNRTAAAITFRLSVAVGGGATTDKDYTHYDVSLDGNDTYVSPTYTLAADDVLRGYASAVDLGMTVMGVES